RRDVGPGRHRPAAAHPADPRRVGAAARPRRPGRHGAAPGGLRRPARGAVRVGPPAPPDGVLARRPARRGAGRPGGHGRRGHPRLATAPPPRRAGPLGRGARVSPSTRRTLRSYGPLLAVAVAFVVMATTVSADPRERVEYAGSVQVPNVGGPEGIAQ